jgi:glycosyltransferase involved in cell wall biosynthesis
MRVCFLTHYFPPEVGAPQTRIELLARTLAARGIEVTVHTGFPHYPDGAVAAPYRNRPWLVERRDGFSIVRSAVYPAPNRGFYRRLADHAAFGLSAVATARLSGPAEVVVAETPPLFTAAAAVAYAAVKRAALVVNVADRWPASAVALGALRDHRAIAAASALEGFVYRHADLIVAPTEGIVAALDREPAARGRTRRMWPVVDIERFHPTPRSPSAEPAPLELLYAGTIGLAHGLETLVEATRLAGPEIVRTTIAGDGAGAQDVRNAAAAGRVTNLRMLGTVPADRIPELYASSDAAAVLIRDLEIFEGALPTKMFEAMAGGRAVILAARGESAELVRAAGAGLVIEPGDPAALARACAQLHGDRDLRLALGSAGQRFAAAHFGARRAADAWLAQLSSVTAMRRASPAAEDPYRAG